MLRHVIASFVVVLCWCYRSAAQYDDCTGDAVFDGRCDSENNSPLCGYDGGDCCACTCVDGPIYVCSESDFNCLDPACTSPALTSRNTECTGESIWISDGYCDAENNNPSCDYDGGDCCECTCLEGLQYSCGSNGFDCGDPTCIDPTITAEFPSCTGNLASFGDGTCTAENNNPLCGFDGGDCCLCTCVGLPCAGLSFECLDPDAGDEINECNSTPFTVVPCSSEGQRSWVVGNSAQAQAMATAINCSGGVFEVEWRGNVVVEQTIYVVDGTVLNVTGDGSSACMDGNSSNRILTIINASLHASGISISHGASIAGGAIAATGSSLTFNRTSFYANDAAGPGGALFVSGGSTVSFVGGTFSNNHAGFDGGAFSVSDSSVVTCIGEAWSFLNNTARDDAGALLVSGGSTVLWNQEAVFAGNTAGRYGGALYARQGSSVSWSAVTTFDSNSAAAGGAVFIRDGSVALGTGGGLFVNNTAAGIGGGAVFVSNNSITSWGGNTRFQSNRASSRAGAIAMSEGSLASWEGETTFVGNTAGADGGAMSVTDGCYVSWEGETTFVDNTAGAGGGAMSVADGCFVFWNGETTLVNNSAGIDGGAMYVIVSSSVSWGGTTTLVANRAEGRGGAVAVDTGSNGFWDGEIYFSGNAASKGGALSVINSSVSFGGSTTFHNNHATYPGTTNGSREDGGALFMLRSYASWSGDAIFTDNHADNGGAVYAWRSSVSWSGQMIMRGNHATDFGGALSIQRSRVMWDAASDFFNNMANIGGALFVGDASNVSWSGQTTMAGNQAANSGGAIGVQLSSLAWGAKTMFLNNSAGTGGALLLMTNSSVSWSGETTFAHNHAGNDALVGDGAGGALVVLFNSSVYWSGETRFINDSAETFGGALHVSASDVFWVGGTSFSESTAEYGGSIFLTNGSSVGWSGRTEFTSNDAGSDGGAVGSLPSDSRYNPQDSTLVINGTTTFANNTCGANGGALAVLGALSVVVNAADVTFVGNSAVVSGGAVFVSGADVGFVFTGTTFASNVAYVGGGVFSTGSGSAKNSIAIDDVPNPMKYDGCRFINNQAVATGGAVDSAAGQDVFVGVLFEGNTALVGGGLRLAGTASLDSCAFVENFSSAEAGPAVSNIGYISRILNISFAGNVFNCDQGTFLDFNASSEPYETICDGCRTTCEGCSFDDPLLVPICTDVMDHAASPGGTVTLETISIDRGYWRATASSPEVLRCYNQDACLGGATGSPGYCLEGYMGPYCSICGDGYTAGLAFSCTACSDNKGGIVLAVCLTTAALGGAAAVAWHLISGEFEGRGRGVIAGLARYLPLQSLKIVIVVWQILTQFTAVTNTTYPGVYQRFLQGLEVFNFDLSWILSAGCIFDVDFHDQLLISTIGPFVALVLLATTYGIAAHKNRGSTEALRNTKQKHVSMILLLTFLVYSNVSSVLFKTFACETLDDRKRYLRTDYRIECDTSEHMAFQVYAGFMILFYTIGIPVFYAGLLFKNRDVLSKEGTDREDVMLVRSISDLWKPYKPSVFYYEVIECGRRIMLSSVIVFIYPDTAAQIAVTLIIAFGFAIMSESLAPYASSWDTWNSRVGHVVVFVSMYVSLLLKVDVSGERASSQKVFEAVLVAVHACMLLAILVEGVVIGCSLRATEELREHPTPRFRRGAALPWTRHTDLAQGDPFSGDIEMVDDAPIS